MYLIRLDKLNKQLPSVKFENPLKRDYVLQVLGTK